MKILVGQSNIFLFLTLLCSNNTGNFVQGENISRNREKLPPITHERCERRSGSVTFHSEVKSTEYQCTKLEHPSNHTVFSVNNEVEQYPINSSTKKSIGQKEIGIQVQGENLNVAENSSLPHFKLTFRLLIVLVVLTCLTSYAKMKVTRTARLLNKFPGDPILPFIGSLLPLALVGPSEKLIDVVSAKFEMCENRCFRLWKLMGPNLYVADAKTAQAVLGGPDYSHKGAIVNEFKWAFGEGLVTSEGETWRKDRKLMNPFFNYQRFDGFFNSFNQHSKILIKILKNEESSFMDLHPFLTRCTMDLISESALGVTTSFQNESEHEFYRALVTMGKSFAMRMIQPYLNLPIIWYLFGMGREEPGCKKVFKDYVTPIIEKRRQNSVADDKTNPFIDALLDAGKSDEDIIAHIITIFAAGFETTASTINFTLFLLALNPQHQTKVQQELESVFGEDTTRDVTFNDLAGLKYLEMCLKESLRLFPTTAGTSRTPQSDINLENGLVIPKGCCVVLSAYHMHRDPSQFPNPEKFDPERFLPEECVKRHPYAFIPFSIGARNCIGQKYAMMQMKTILAHILRNFSVSTEGSREELKIIFGMVLEPVGCGIRLKLNKKFRNSESGLQ